MVQKPYENNEKRATDTSRNLVYMKLSAGQGSEQITVSRAKGCEPHLLWSPGGKISNLSNQHNLGPRTEVMCMGPALVRKALAFINRQTTSPASGPGSRLVWAVHRNLG